MERPETQGRAETEPHDPRVLPHLYTQEDLEELFPRALAEGVAREETEPEQNWELYFRPPALPEARSAYTNWFADAPQPPAAAASEARRAAAAERASGRPRLAEVATTRKAGPAALA